MKKKRIKILCISGTLTALVFVLTAYLHIPSHTGYVHVGDAFIYLAASLLPLPFGPMVGAAGALLADCLTGYAVWAPGSIIVKALSALLFSSRGDKLLTLRNGLMTIPSALICVGGYYLYEAVISGNFAAPLAGIAGNCTQSILSGLLFLLLALALDRLKIKKLLDI